MGLLFFVEGPECLLLRDLMLVLADVIVESSWGADTFPLDTWIACPIASAAASMIASPKVGWGCIVSNRSGLYNYHFI